MAKPGDGSDAGETRLDRIDCFDELSRDCPIRCIGLDIV